MTKYFVVLEATDNETRIWKDAFKPCFEPYVFTVEQNSKEFLLLCSNRLNSSNSTVDMMDFGFEIVRQLNGIVNSFGYHSNVKFVGLATKFANSYQISYYMKVESTTVYFGAGVIEFNVFDENGRKIFLPPNPTVLQRDFQIADNNELLADAWMYVAGDQDWFDLYKAFECIREFYRRNSDEEFFTEEVKLFYQTANRVYRHRRGKEKVPDNPMQLLEARRLLNRLLRRASLTAQKSLEDLPPTDSKTN